MISHLKTRIPQKALTLVVISSLIYGETFGQFAESFETPSGTYQEGYLGAGNPAPTWYNAAEPFYNGYISGWGSGHGKPWVSDLPKTQGSSFWLDCPAADEEKAAVLFTNLWVPGNNDDHPTPTASIYLNYPVSANVPYRLSYKMSANNATHSV